MGDFEKPRSSAPRSEDFEKARAHTVRYHERLYATTPLGTRGWLARPSDVILEAVDRVTEPTHAYDLGAGVGRHTIPMAQRLPTGSRVTAVDLLPNALDRLADNARDEGVGARIDTVVADLEEFRYDSADAGLTVCFSALEHVSSRAAFRRLLARIRDATVPGGLIALVVFADRLEVTAEGPRPALVELPLTTEQARTALEEAFAGWEVVARHTAEVSAPEERDGETFTLAGTEVGLMARFVT